MFGWAPVVPVDEEINQPRDLIDAHTGYLDQPDFYRVVGERLGVMR